MDTVIRSISVSDALIHRCKQLALSPTRQNTRPKKATVPSLATNLQVSNLSNSPKATTETCETTSPAFSPCAVIVTGLSQPAATVMSPKLPVTSTTAFKSAWTMLRSMVASILFLTFSVLLVSYKSESAEAGFCDALSATNYVLRTRAATMGSQVACSQMINAAYRANNFDSEQNCSPLSLIPWPTPTSCTPCPVNAAECTLHAVTCAVGFNLRHHPLERVFSTWLDGLPGLGSVAFPPECAIDLDWEEKVYEVARHLDRHLVQQWNRLPCPSDLIPLAQALNESELRQYAFKSSRRVSMLTHLNNV